MHTDLLCGALTLRLPPWNIYVGLLQAPCARQTPRESIEHSSLMLPSSSHTVFSTATTLIRLRRRGFGYATAVFSRLLPLKAPTPNQPVVIPKALPPDVPIEGELISGYNPKHFYHPNPGELLDGKFQLKAKIGWGTTSTVWLAQDIRWRLGSKPFVAIKITDNRPHDEAASRHEVDISNYIDSFNSEQSGHQHIRTVKDSFEISGPDGLHPALVLEPMLEPIWLLRRQLGADRVTRDFLLIFKMHIIVLLDSLDYLHTKSRIIHTGKYSVPIGVQFSYHPIRLDNILVTFEDKSVIDEFIQGQVQEPMPRKVLDDRTVYLSHNDFGPLRIINGTPALMKIFPKIVDFSLAQKGDGPEPLIIPIQPEHYDAPEVIFGTG
jgi:serine/threonine-protein kinase SRPK3